MKFFAFVTLFAALFVFGEARYVHFDKDTNVVKRRPLKRNGKVVNPADIIIAKSEYAVNTKCLPKKEYANDVAAQEECSSPYCAQLSLTKCEPVVDADRFLQ